MTVRMLALRSWRNKEFEGDVSAGQEFESTANRAAVLERHKLAVRALMPRVRFTSNFDWNDSANTTTAYKANFEYDVPPACADQAVASGKAVLLANGSVPNISGPAPVSTQTAHGALHPPLHIVIPAYKEHYVNYATKYVIPSIKAALDQRNCKVAPHFLVHTDMPARFEKALDGYPVTIKRVPSESGFKGLSAAHRDVIASAPVGAIVTLLNADIMVSREAFVVADLIFARGYKAIASIGMRSLIQGEEPPVGASAKELLAWSWRNRHFIAEDGVWGRGKTRTPTTIFFEQADNVVVHCFHLHPFFVHKDRPLEFKGTIDDDLLARYKDDEVYVLRDAEIGFAELSWREKTQATGTPLTAHSIIEAGRSYIPAHVRNFRNQIRVTGDGSVDTSVATMIADGVAKRWNRR